jgi:hypothetical protein
VFTSVALPAVPTPSKAATDHECSYDLTVLPALGRTQAGQSLWQLAKERGATKVSQWLDEHSEKLASQGAGCGGDPAAAVVGSALLHRMHFRCALFYDRSPAAVDPGQELGADNGHGGGEGEGMSAAEYFLSFDADGDGGLDAEELKSAVNQFLRETTSESENDEGEEADDGSDALEPEQQQQQQQQREREAGLEATGTAAGWGGQGAAQQGGLDPRRVVERTAAATNLPCVVSSSELSQGPSSGARLLRSFRRLFAAHQEHFSLSISLVLRNDWGAEWVRPLLDRCRLPPKLSGRGGGACTMQLLGPVPFPPLPAELAAAGEGEAGGSSSSRGSSRERALTPVEVTRAMEAQRVRFLCTWHEAVDMQSPRTPPPPPQQCNSVLRRTAR